IHAEVLGGELINVTPVQAARRVYGHSLSSFDCVKCPRVLPPMNLSAAIGEREHAAAAMPARRKIKEGLAPAVPTDDILADIQIVLVNVQEHAQLRARPACNVTTLQKNRYL